jgi:hypothetical protein
VRLLDGLVDRPVEPEIVGANDELPQPDITETAPRVNLNSVIVDSKADIQARIRRMKAQI